jgi:hypothetical protein
VAGGWRKLFIEEPNSLYSSAGIIRAIKSGTARWAEHVARMGTMRNTYNILVKKPEENILLGSGGRKWEDNIKFDVPEMGFGV